MGYKFYEISKLNKLSAQALNTCSGNPLFPGLTRLIFTDASTFPIGNLHKVIEKVEFNTTNNNGKYALAIGLNPAKADQKIFDSTNRNIAYYFKNKNYKGFYLVNLYTILAPSAEVLIKQLNTNKYDENEELVKYYLNRGYDTFIFWGPKAKKYGLINDKIKNIILSLINSHSKKLFFCIDNNNYFVHPWNFAPQPNPKQIAITYMDFVNFNEISNINDVM